jgi:tetratricopeptide (TPR) repeat protein
MNCLSSREIRGAANLRNMAAWCCGAAALLLALVVPSWAQRPSSQGPSRPSGPTSGTAPNVPGGEQPGLGQSPSQMQSPLYVNGRVLLMDTGQPAPEPVSVQLACGVNLLQVISTDLKGYFQFVLGAGPQSNANLSAADETPIVMGGASGMGSSRPYGRSGSFGDLTGCELRVSVDGYQPASHVLSGPPDLSSIDVGTMRLVRIAGVQGSAISVTSLAVPSGARKEFEKGDKDFRNNKLTSAAEHLQKAVVEYDMYAAAWNELGGIYIASHETEKAGVAFGKAIAADPKYIPPYVHLANLQLENQEYEQALSTSGKALELDPRIELANFIQALANFRLNRLDAAQKIALEAEKGPRPIYPQWHALLADIFLEKKDPSSAADQMRAYLKEAPKGPLAPQMKKSLDQIESSGTAAESQPTSSPAKPQANP